MTQFKNALCLEIIPEGNMGDRWIGLSLRHKRCQRRLDHEGPHRSYSRVWWTLDKESIDRNVAEARKVIAAIKEPS